MDKIIKPNLTGTILQKYYDIIKTKILCSDPLWFYQSMCSDFSWFSDFIGDINKNVEY